MIENIRNFLLKCPYLKKGRLLVDYLTHEVGDYSIEVLPTKGTLKTYLSGDKLKEMLFVFASREFYGSDAISNMENLNFYEDFSNWLKEKSNKKELPYLDENKTAQFIESISSGYVYDEQAKSARYQIQIRLVYYEKEN